jgi:hypothetical protein
VAEGKAVSTDQVQGFADLMASMKKEMSRDAD